jgi:tetratricopeptide (TPR) repeat protein
MPYDLFISYSRRDDKNGRVHALKEQIELDYRSFAKEELRCFFDLKDIASMDDWRHRILEGLRDSNLLLLVLSPAYLDSSYCEWEIVEFLKYEHSRSVGGQGVTPVYFVEIPGLDEPGFEARAAAWLARVRRRNQVDLRPWYYEGVEALKQTDVRRRLDDLEQSLHTRISRLRRLRNAPGNLPAHNPRFVGREAEMQRLHEAAGLGRFGVLTAVQGMGGVGKTALAIQYAYAYADFYPGGRWLIGCAGENSLAAAVRRLDLDLGITLNDAEKRDDTLAARRVLAELERRTIEDAKARSGEKDPPQPKALLLLDNVDNPELLQPPQSDLLTGRQWLHILATTRSGTEEFGNDPECLTVLSIDELPEDDALRLIESYQPYGRFPSSQERQAALELVKLLGGFTLAVEVVAVHLGERAGRVTCAAFLQRMKKEGLAGLDSAALATKKGIKHGEKLIGATLKPTLDLLSEQERLVLSYAALLPPDTIPLPWLRFLASKDFPELGIDAEPGYDDPWLSLVNHLIGLRMLQVKDIDPVTHAPRLMRMHRLVGELVRANSNALAGACMGNSLTSDNRHLDNQMKQLVAHATSRAIDLRNSWISQICRWEIEPLRSLSWQLMNDSSLHGAELAVWAALPLSFLARHVEAKQMLEKVIAMREQLALNDDLDLATAYNNLGYESFHLGNYSEAEYYLRKAIVIREKSPTNNELDIANTYSLLGEVMAVIGNLQEAIRLTNECLKIEERRLPSSQNIIAIRYSNLCGYEASLGNLQEARRYGQKALQINESIHESAHPDLAISYNALGLVEQEIGNLSEAETLLRRSLDVRIVLYGSEHSSVANGAVNLARILLARGQTKEAESYASDALIAWQKSETPEDFRCGKAHWVLGTVAFHRGETAVAKHHLEEALRLLKKGRGATDRWCISVREELDQLE